jgi:anti-anti-sigma factor
MSDTTDSPADPPHAELKGDGGRARCYNIGDVTVFVVENKHVYPKQVDEVLHVIRDGIAAAAEPKVVVDLGNVEFVCSAFIGGFVALHKLAHSKSGELKICVTDKRIVDTMKTLRLTDLIEIGDDVRELAGYF